MTGERDGQFILEDVCNKNTDNNHSTETLSFVNTSWFAISRKKVGFTIVQFHEKKCFLNLEKKWWLDHTHDVTGLDFRYLS